MPDELTGTPRARRSPGRTLVLCAVVVLAFAASGALAGVLWHAWWEAPMGVVAREQWFPVPPETSQRADFGGVGRYVVVALATGLVVGALVAVALRGREVAALVAAVLGAVLGGWLMARVGMELSPPDPEVLARTAEDGTRLPGRLHLPGWSPYTMMPIGAVLALLACILLTPGRADVRPGPAREQRDTTVDDAAQDRD